MSRPGGSAVSSTEQPVRAAVARSVGLHHDAHLARVARDEMMAALDFDRAPFVIAWELTRACAYACAHCRADAQPRRDPNELDTDEAHALIERLARFGSHPILVLTGGDPLMRRDLFDLARHATDSGLRVSLTPTATALPTRKRMREAREAGIRRVAFSVDAASPDAHDRFRGFEGSFARTLAAIANARAEGMAIQINTTVCGENAGELPWLVELLEQWGAVQWSLFFLVPVGRGVRLAMLAPSSHEAVLEWLCDISRLVPFDIKATASPQYRRIVHRRSFGVSGAGYRFADGLNRPPSGKGVNDGRGFMFISHTGEVMPSGFLPVSAGNVRESDPVDLYRDSALFRALRDSDALQGKCGLCEFRSVCGGSRARAYAVSGDPLASDPSCPYIPQIALDSVLNPQ
jgi:AdoMet-dependent heme synthase